MHNLIIFNFFFFFFFFFLTRAEQIGKSHIVTVYLQILQNNIRETIFFIQNLLADVKCIY